jgi:hypothetical protein
MNYYVARVPYRQLQKAFHQWVKNKKVKLNDRGDRTFLFLAFRASFPSGQLNGLEIPKKLTVYKLFNKHHDFFMPFRGYLSTVKWKNSRKKKGIKFNILLEKDLLKLEAAIMEKVHLIVEGVQKIRDDAERAEALSLENSELRKQLLGAQRIAGGLENKISILAKSLGSKKSN